MINFGFYETGSKNYYYYYFNCYMFTLINGIYYICIYNTWTSYLPMSLYMGMKAEMTIWGGS